MGLSKYIQSRELLERLGTMHPEELRTHVLARTRAWYEQNPGDIKLVKSNLARFGLDTNPGLVQKIIEHIGLHYFEKLVGLCQTPQAFHDFLKQHVDTSSAVEVLKKAQHEGKGALLAVAHYGAVELTVPSLSMQGLVLSAALRFKTEKLSHGARARARAFADTGLFSPISFIEVGKAGTHAALDMAAVLRRKEMLLSVFDEKTDYSFPVTLFNVDVWGGAGLDKLIQFAGAQTVVFAAFMVRDEQGNYRLDLDPVAPSGKESITQMYMHLERHVGEQPHQWYFLHEEVPFVE